MAPPTYKAKTYLFVLPKQVPGTQVRCPVYARVTAGAGNRGQQTLKCQTIATDAAAAMEFEVPRTDCELQIVTAKEATTKPLGVWLRQFVFSRTKDAPSPVKCKRSTSRTRSEAVESISPVSAILLWEFDVSLAPAEEAEKLMERARRTHARIVKRIKDPANGSRDLAFVLAKIMPEGEGAPATVDLVSPATGKKTRVSAQRVVDHLFYSVEGRKAPEDGSVGDQYWEDPRFGDLDDDELDDGPESDQPESSDSEPVTAAMLWHLRAGLDFDDPQQRSLWGATLLGFFFLLRKSEYLHEGPKPAKHGLCVRDIRFTTAFEEVATSEDQVHEVHIKLSSSKTDQRRGGVTLRLSRPGSSWLCPIPAIWELRRIAVAAGVKANEPLCTTIAPDEAEPRSTRANNEGITPIAP
ncbi:hypothetical protein SDRG_15996 [Saprolegnia diclina VS20]|uniref:Uncharacterized protein n=1 Tax=Saprolegnia diclina (strain VS20) TaxID=1156394 RepID=T0R9K2_SAPDV|nr:hypothetical protein SDRG_15996 [Saprolegnia diclina VS20]EQC26192.1 hypothetical protein SDRG_15996 [Saprolegnia diclina VS20]|eukprot:XP_008620407.1 hypothetical protein SDRG_15996 [Saprolegnia diclina VS20]